MCHLCHLSVPSLLLADDDSEDSWISFLLANNNKKKKKRFVKQTRSRFDWKNVLFRVPSFPWRNEDESGRKKEEEKEISCRSL